MFVLAAAAAVAALAWMYLLALPRRVLADGPAAATRPGPGRVAGGDRGGAGPQRGGGAARHPSLPADAGLPRQADGDSGRRRLGRRHRAGRGKAGRRIRSALPGFDTARPSGPAPGRLGGQGVGHGVRPGNGRPAGIRAVHRRGHQLRAGHADRPGPRRGRRRLRPRLADGPAAHRDRLGAADRARVRVLLRPALPVPPGEPAAGPDGRRGRAAACWCAARTWPRPAAWP